MAWLSLYRQGHLRGLCVQPAGDGKLHARIQKKSPYLDFHLSRAASALNAIETVMGEPPAWTVLGELLLTSPPSGTKLGADDMLNVLQRV